MKKAGLITALCVEVLGIWVIIDSYRLGLQALSKPGPGSYPFVLGILLFLLGLPLCVSSFRQIETNRTTKGGSVNFSSRLKRIAIIIGCLLGYSLLLDFLGFPLTTFLFLFVLFLMGYPGRWVSISTYSILLVVFSYVVFSILLRVPLPFGVFSR